MYAAKGAGGNAKSTAAHQKVTETSQMMVAAADDLTDLLEKADAEAGLITGKENAKCCGIVYCCILVLLSACAYNISSQIEKIT